MSVLVDTINCSLGDLQTQYAVEIIREYGIKKSAGIGITDIESGDRIISMDIDIKPLIGSKIYYLGETSIKGVLSNEILADKICTISSDAVYNHRAKDIIDVYSLSHCTSINIKEIYDVCQRANRKIQSFDAFFKRKPDVEHAYNKLKGIEGRPAFSDVYTYLSGFIKPFAEKNFSDKIWNFKEAMWEENPILTKNNRFFFSRSKMNNNAKKIEQENIKSEEQNRKKSMQNSID